MRWELGFVGLIACLPTAVGCYSRDTVPAKGLAEIRAARSEEGVVFGDDGDGVRVDPNSSIRFLRSDGTWTSWRRASDLYVNDEGVYVRVSVGGGFEATDGLRWTDVEAAEVHNLSGGKTLVGIMATTAIVAALIPIAMLTRKAPDIPLRLTSTVVHVGVHASRGGGGSPQKAEGEEDVVLTDEPLGKPGYEQPTSDGGRPLFDGTTRRRSKARFGAAMDYGQSFTGAKVGSFGVLGTLRFLDFVEIGAGARWLGRRVGYDVVPVARFGFHAELDPRRRFALPFSIDVGWLGPVKLHARLNFGLRIRATEHLSFGLYPFNPTYARLEPGLPDAPRSPWSFPSMVESTFVF